MRRYRVACMPYRVFFDTLHMVSACGQTNARRLGIVFLCAIATLAFVPYAFAGGSGSAESELLLINDRYMYVQIETDPAILRGDVHDVRLEVMVMDADADPPAPVSGVGYALELVSGLGTTLLELDAYSPDGSSVLVIKPDNASERVDIDGDYTDGSWLAASDSGLYVNAPVFLEGGLIHALVDIRTIDAAPVVAPEGSEFEILLSMGEFIPFEVEIDGTPADLVFATYFDRIDKFAYDGNKKRLSATMPFGWDPSLIDSIPFLHAEYYIPRSVKIFEDHEISLSVNDVPYFGTVDRSGDDEIVVHFLISSSKLHDLLDKIPSNERDHITFEISSGKKIQKQKNDASLEAGNAIIILSDREDWKFYLSLDPRGAIHADQDMYLNVEFRDPVTNIVIPMITYDVDVLLDGQYVFSESGRNTPDGGDQIRLKFGKTGSAIIQISNVNGYATSGEIAFQVGDGDSAVNGNAGSGNAAGNSANSYDYNVGIASGSFLAGCERGNSCFEPHTLEVLGQVLRI